MLFLPLTINPTIPANNVPSSNVGDPVKTIASNNGRLSDRFRQEIWASYENGEYDAIIRVGRKEFKVRIFEEVKGICGNFDR